MGRKILFITTDQQRYDSLGCNGNRFCKTPTIDALARDGINYARAYNQNTVCMPARSTMLTGQYVRTHGVFANGVPLPESAPSVAQYLKDNAGYKTALIGKAHFEPAFDMTGKWRENRRQMEGDFGPWRGFDYAIHAMHIASFRGNPAGHYGRWMQKNHPECFNMSPPLLNASPGGDTGAPETSNNPVPRAFYHTD
jgi:arylsulfatase A-like enzyme